MKLPQLIAALQEHLSMFPESAELDLLVDEGFDENTDETLYYEPARPVFEKIFWKRRKYLYLVLEGGDRS